MEILLIGNGFDLAHGLPTKYRDFLDFCQGIEILYSEPFASLKDYDAKLDETLRTDVSPEVRSICHSALLDKDRDMHIIVEGLEDLELLMTRQEAIQELYELIHNNVWIQYFNERASRIGENWIDFESEISAVVQSLDAAYRISSEFSTLATKIWRISTWPFHDAFDDTVTDAFINFLNEELAKLIRALEIYISGFVNDLTIKQENPDINQLHPDHVLSFNYSDTYERVYGSKKKIAYDYIHGEARLYGSIDSCNLVLGIDEYLDDNQKTPTCDSCPLRSSISGC